MPDQILIHGQCIVTSSLKTSTQEATVGVMGIPGPPDSAHCSTFSPVGCDLDYGCSSYWSPWLHRATGVCLLICMSESLALLGYFGLLFPVWFYLSLSPKMMLDQMQLLHTLDQVHFKTHLLQPLYIYELLQEFII